MRAPRLLDFEGTFPRTDPGVYVAPGARVIGDVRLGEMSSVWYNAVIRGDVAAVEIGARTNIQDLSMIHVTTGKYSTTIGEGVTVGHRTILHGCVVEDHCLIGMGAILLDGVVVGEGSLVAAGTLLTEGTVIQPGSMVMGSPGKVRRALTAEELQNIRLLAAHYVELARRHQEGRGGNSPWRPVGE